jgi:HlyD family secretion protein
MDTRLFRKSAIERLSSPEELDLVIKISNHGSWAALVAILLLCGAASVWAIKGSVPTAAIGHGMIVRPSGVITLVSRGAGAVRSVDVTVGERVRRNQVVATIAQPALEERLRGMRASLAELRRKRDRDLQLKADEIRMRSEAIARQRANTERAILETEKQVQLAASQIPVMEQLFGRGLVTNQQVIGARQKLVELEGQVEESKAVLTQLDAQQFELRSQAAALDSEMQFQIASAERDIAAVVSELTLLESVVTPHAGVVLEVKVLAGGTVGSDAPLISIQPDSDTLEALVYVSALQAKDIRVGMEAQVSPSTVKREEYGYIRGQVAFVADYPATTASLMRNFQNEQLVSAMFERGPVTEVRVALERDANARSGFRWSSPGGPPVRISAGTLAMTEVVTRRRAPLTLVVPLLRETLGVN